MKDLGKTKYYPNLQIEHKTNEVLIQQSTYVEKILKRFNIGNAHILSTPMAVQFLCYKKDPFRPKEDDEKILDPKVPYLNAISALLYLA